MTHEFLVYVLPALIVGGLIGFLIKEYMEENEATKDAIRRSRKDFEEWQKKQNQGD